MEGFYNDMLEVVSGVGMNCSVIIMGDLNARIGNRNRLLGEVAGRYGESMGPNSNGGKLLDFCQAKGLAITNSFFKHKKIHQFTWEETTRERKSTLDYVKVDQELRKYVKDTRLYMSFEISSDHHLVGTKINIGKPAIREFRERRQIIRIEKLEDVNIRREYIKKGSLEREWGQLKIALIETAKDNLEISVCNDGGNRTNWWDNFIKEACRKKKQYKRFLQNRNDENMERYVEARSR